MNLCDDNTSNALKALNSVNATQFNASDSISRQAAIEVAQNRPMMLSKEKVLLINDLEKLPPAEPKIIHCKDCKYFKQVFAPNDNDGLCGHWHSKCDARTNRNGYCSHAERKQNDTERC